MGAPEVDEETVIERSPQAVAGDLPDETILFHVGEGIALRINSTAAGLWAQIAEPAKIADLADWLAERHGIERERAVDDVAAFANDLISRGFVELG